MSVAQPTNVPAADAAGILALSPDARHAAANFVVPGRPEMVWWRVAPPSRPAPLPLLASTHLFDLAAWSPDGRWLAAAVLLENHLIMYAIPSGKIAWERSGQTRPLWSPDGRRLAVSLDAPPEKGPRTAIVDPASGKSLTTLRGRSILAWSPDGRTALTVHLVPGRERKLIYALENTRDWRRMRTLDRRVVGLIDRVAWSPDGKTLALAVDYNAGEPGTFGWLVDTSSGKVLHALQNRDAAAKAVCWSPDSRHVLFAHTEYSGATGYPDVAVYARAGGRLVQRLTGPKEQVYHLVWPAKGDGPVALVSDGRQAEVWKWKALGLGR